MRKTKEQQTKDQKLKTSHGITLIALIITIIIMIILVAVTVTMAVNGGLFSKAQTAGTQTNEAVKKEQELGNGRIKIGGTWYDSPQDYVNDKLSKNQGDGENDKDDNCTKCSGLKSYRETFCSDCGSINIDSEVKIVFTLECSHCWSETGCTYDLQIGEEVECPDCGEYYVPKYDEEEDYYCADCSSYNLDTIEKICECADCKYCGDLHYIYKVWCDDCDTGDTYENGAYDYCSLCDKRMDPERYLCPYCGECETCFDAGVLEATCCSECGGMDCIEHCYFLYVCPECGHWETDSESVVKTCANCAITDKTVTMNESYRDGDYMCSLCCSFDMSDKEIDCPDC